MNIGTLINIWLNFKHVGTDKFGNRYYISKNTDCYGNYRRSVIYNGIVEPSKIPPMWNSWLRSNADQIPNETKLYEWQKEHQPNFTGTEKKYLPAGHLEQNDKRVEFGNHYESWKP